jgi:hypothetical protein
MGVYQRRVFLHIRRLRAGGGTHEMTSTNTNTNTNKEVNQATIFLLTILQAVINEQVQIRELKSSTGKYIYDAVKSEASKLGYLNVDLPQNSGVGVIED